MSKVSQRIGAYNGGVQPGTSATTSESRTIDLALKNAANNAFAELSLNYPELEKRAKIVLPSDCKSAQPDGGAWYYQGELIAVFEAKKQGRKGNACERWFANWRIAKHVNPDSSYVTFVTREGASEGTSTWKTFNTALLLDGRDREWNVYNPGGVSFYGNVEGFDLGTVTSVMIECVEERIKSNT
jgi:hypothetical protein